MANRRSRLAQEKVGTRWRAQQQKGIHAGVAFCPSTGDELAAEVTTALAEGIITCPCSEKAIDTAVEKLIEETMGTYTGHDSRKNPAPTSHYSATGSSGRAIQRNA
jgi:hypothetical protein